MSSKVVNIWTGLPAVFLLCSGLFTAGAIAADEPARDKLTGDWFGR